jgi:hypothetical protein
MGFWRDERESYFERLLSSPFLHSMEERVAEGAGEEAS